MAPPNHQNRCHAHTSCPDVLFGVTDTTAIKQCDTQAGRLTECWDFHSVSALSVTAYWSVQSWCTCKGELVVAGKGSLGPCKREGSFWPTLSTAAADWKVSKPFAAKLEVPTVPTNPRFLIQSLQYSSVQVNPWTDWIVRGIWRTIRHSFLREAIVNSSGMSRDVPFLTLSIQHFLCRPWRRQHSKVPWGMVLERLSWRVTCYNHVSFRILTVARGGSCGPTKFILLRTQLFVVCSS